MWIAAISVIAFIAVCETALFFARRNPAFVAKLYMLDDVLTFDSSTDTGPDLPAPRNNDLL